MTPKTFTGETEAQDCCAYWQRQLRLSDWQVKIKIVRRYDLQPGRVAQCEYFITSKSAIISLLDAIDFHPATEFVDRDHEVGLVHELLHLHVALFEPKAETLEQKMSEVAIESIAQALVLLNRGIRL
ncbi:MAG TPA: hypothetical protein VLR90_08570 [Blastocatellia bacterium]|nr:hypothetical protein [Blastocatellia bacterium]